MVRFRSIFRVTRALRRRKRWFASEAFFSVTNPSRTKVLFGIRNSEFGIRNSESVESGKGTLRTVAMSAQTSEAFSRTTLVCGVVSPFLRFSVLLICRDATPKAGTRFDVVRDHQPQSIIGRMMVGWRVE